MESTGVTTAFHLDDLLDEGNQDLLKEILGKTEGNAVIHEIETGFDGFVGPVSFESDEERRRANDALRKGLMTLAQMSMLSGNKAQTARILGELYVDMIVMRR